MGLLPLERCLAAETAEGSRATRMSIKGPRRLIRLVSDLSAC